MIGGRLEGTGNQCARFAWTSGQRLDPYPRTDGAGVEIAGADLKTGRGQVVLKSKVTT
jgi:hypothetical protein